MCIALLLEKKILLCSCRTALLTVVAEVCFLKVFPTEDYQGLVSLIRPMSWEHAYIPVLPRQLLQFTQAPSPFVMGIHNSLLSEAVDEGVEEVGTGLA